MTIFTVGHSTRSLAEMISLLQVYGIKQLIDVRTIPRSRHTPQFNAESFAAQLTNEDIAYHHIPELGGLRHAKPDSPNSGWRNASFRGYADYMQSPEFLNGLSHLIQLAQEKPTAIMCAEAVPWRCHRSMIGDALLVRHIDVIDIFDEHTAKPETLTRFAHVEGLSISYPPPSDNEDTVADKRNGAS
jgi:uncharacterized protein (DUF488 family)